MPCIPAYAFDYTTGASVVEDIQGARGQKDKGTEVRQQRLQFSMRNPHQREGQIE